MSRRWLSAVVVGTSLALCAPMSGAAAGEPGPAPQTSATDTGPEPTPVPSPEATPEPTPEATPEPTPEATPEPTPEASPDVTPEPTPAATPAAEPVAAPALPVQNAVQDTGQNTVQNTARRSAPFNLKVQRVKRKDIRYTYRPGCPVGPSGLRRLVVTFYGYDDDPHRGNIIVRKSAVRDISAVFRRAHKARFPIKRMYPVDKYRGSDVRSMAANNTSAFNCRHVVGNPSRLSQHSYGNAVDVNTRQNPYVTGSRVYPAGARTYLNRSNVRKGMLTRSGPIPREFASRRWYWGARWAHPDYQHFSSNGR